MLGFSLTDGTKKPVLPRADDVVHLQIDTGHLRLSVNRQGAPLYLDQKDHISIPINGDAGWKPDPEIEMVTKMVAGLLAIKGFPGQAAIKDSLSAAITLY